MPNDQQYIVGARKAGTLLEKENELIDCLLTLTEVAPWHLNNNCLRAELSQINPSQSHLTAKQLRNIHLWGPNCIYKKVIRREKSDEGKEGS